MFRVLLASFLTLSAIAAEETGLSVSLISESRTIVPGKPFTVGLHLQHDEGYHTYWKHPGIVGIATAITWDLPEGFTASEIQWPHPERCLMAGHPCNGYERDVTLLVTITPPAEIEKNRIDLQCDARWMCCARTCHPGLKRLSLKLPVSDKLENHQKSHQLIESARSEIPIHSPEWTAQVMGQADSDPIVIKLTSTTGEQPSEVFSSDGQFTDMPTMEAPKSDDSPVVIRVPRSEFSPTNSEHLPFVFRVGEQHFALSPAYSLPETGASKKGRDANKPAQ